MNESREKQIEEMAKDLCYNGGVCNLEEWNNCKLKVGEYCSRCNNVAARLINAGYCKQSEGEWVICSDGYYPYCSECKHEPKNGVMTDFCPKCGAKMKGGAE